MDKPKKQFIQQNSDTDYRAKSFSEDSVSLEDQDLILMLSSLFDLKEYKKCAYFAQNRLKQQEKQGKR
jgi:hypothetical protein